MTITDKHYDYLIKRLSRFNDYIKEGGVINDYWLNFKEETIQQLVDMRKQVSDDYIRTSVRLSNRETWF